VLRLPWLEDMNVVLTGAAVDAVLSGLLVLGIANCFFGRRVFRFTVTLLGVAAAAAAGAYGIREAGLGHRQAAVISAAALSGLVALVVLVMFYRAMQFVVGCGAGLGLALAYCAVTGSEASLGLFVGAGLAGGLLTLAAERLVVTLVTAAFGSLATALGVLHFSRRGPSLQQLYDTAGDPAQLRAFADTTVHIALCGAALLFVLSLAVQVQSARDTRATKKAEAPSDDAEEDQ